MPARPRYTELSTCSRTACLRIGSIRLGTDVFEYARDLALQLHQPFAAIVRWKGSLERRTESSYDVVTHVVQKQTRQHWSRCNKASFSSRNWSRSYAELINLLLMIARHHF